MAALVDHIRAAGVRVIFLETGANPRLAEQIADETGIKVVEDLYTHSISEPGGPAPSYLEMMRYNTRSIVDALR
jgi:ABC-type Zn uptake system ZnuABC Zn-binding protein ZnuA